MSISDFIHSTALADLIFHTGVRSLLLSILIAGLVLLCKRISPFVANGLLLTSLFTLSLLPLIEGLPRPASTFSWEFHPIPTSPPPEAAELLPVALANTDSSTSPAPSASVDLDQAKPFDLIAAINTLGIIWLIGMAIVLLRLARAGHQLNRLKKKLQPITKPSLKALWQQIQNEHPIARQVTITQLPLNCSPFACGYRHPLIVLPSSLAEQADAPELENALLHELNHIKQRDLWLIAIQKLTLTLYWWNPIILWLDQQLSLSREKLCDLAVIAKTRNPKAYARTLIGLADTVNSPVPGTTAQMASSFSLLEERIKTIANNRKIMKTPRTNRITWMACSAAIFLALMSFGVRATWAASQGAVATLRSGDNQLVQLSMQDHAIELSVIAEDGKTQSITVDVTDKAKAHEIRDLIERLGLVPSPVQSSQAPVATKPSFFNEPETLLPRQGSRRMLSAPHESTPENAPALFPSLSTQLRSVPIPSAAVKPMIAPQPQGQAVISSSQPTWAPTQPQVATVREYQRHSSSSLTAPEQPTVPPVAPIAPVRPESTRGRSALRPPSTSQAPRPVQQTRRGSIFESRVNTPLSAHQIPTVRSTNAQEMSDTELHSQIRALAARIKALESERQTNERQPLKPTPTTPFDESKPSGLF